MIDIDEHKEANKAKWDHRTATFGNRRYFVFCFMQRELIRSIRISPPCCLLDLGCGTGWAVRRVEQLLGGRDRFVGVVLSCGMSEKARGNAAGVPSVEFYQASANDFLLDDDTFDFVICTNSFHHNIQLVESLKEVKRLLKPGGKMHIPDLTANAPFIHWIDARVRKREKEHVQYFNSVEYGRMFTQAGLRHVDSRRIKIRYPLKVHVGAKENRGKYAKR